MDTEGAEIREEHAFGSNISVSGDTVKQALAEQVRRGEITGEQQALIWWYYCHCRNEGFDLKDAGRAIGKDSTALSRIWHGKYGASPENICQDIARYRKLAEERATRVKLDFVETSTWKIISQVCNAALVSQSMAFIWGDPQMGKTACVEEYARRNNHGQTKFMRMPASAGVQIFMKEIARACYVSPDSCFEKLRDRVLNAIDSQTLIIIDEWDEAFVSYQHGSTIKVMEVIREIYDRSHCGMVLVSSNLGRDEMEHGRHAEVLKRFNRRGIIKIQIPNKVPKSDLDKIARKFNLAPADGIAQEVVKEMIHTSGLGMYIKFLQSAAMMSNREGKRLTWDHFIQAHDIIAKLSHSRKED
jgi:DNA transposition AAA+ family ATPase